MYSSQFLLSSVYLEHQLYLVNHHYLKLEVFFFYTQPFLDVLSVSFRVN